MIQLVNITVWEANTAIVVQIWSKNCTQNQSVENTAENDRLYSNFIVLISMNYKHDLYFSLIT